MNRFFILLLIVTAFNLASAEAQSFQVYDKRTKANITCKKIKTIWEPGTLSEKTGKYTAFKKTIDQLTNRIARSTKNTSPMQKELNKLTKNLPIQQRLCTKSAPKTGKPTATPTSTPKNGSSPIPTATRTPTPSGGCSQTCFNTSRDTKCFKIPSSLTGNETQGASLWNGCKGCHIESAIRNLDYTRILAAFSDRPEMAPIASSYTSADIADITAYLNRYNAKQCRTDWP